MKLGHNIKLVSGSLSKEKFIISKLQTYRKRGEELIKPFKHVSEASTVDSMGWVTNIMVSINFKAKGVKNQCEVSQNFEPA